MAKDRLHSGHAALVVIDVQNDFCPGGTLAVEDGHAVVRPINRWLLEAELAKAPIYLSRDWHPKSHPSFERNGGKWPVHCVQDTPGAALHADLLIPNKAEIISKGTRFDRDQLSAFDETGFGAHLRDEGIKDLWLMGLAQDVCVLDTTKDALAEGFEVNVVVEATRPITADAGERALDEMKKLGANLVVA